MSKYKINPYTGQLDRVESDAEADNELLDKPTYDTDDNAIIDKAEQLDDGAGNVVSAADVKSAVDLKHASGSDDQDLSGLVEKVTGSSLVADTEISKIHTQNSDTDLDATFEATFVKKVDTVNVLSDITSAGADIENAVSLRHTQGTDTGLDTGGTNPVTALEIKTGLDKLANIPEHTSGDLDYYVDSDTGSDSNDGSDEFPFLTINKAISVIPKVINHVVTISCHNAEGYAETILVDGFTGTGSLIINDIGLNTYSTCAIISNNLVNLSITGIFKTTGTCIRVFDSKKVILTSVALGDSGSGTTYGIWAENSEVILHYITNIDANKVTYAITSRYSSVVHIGETVNRNILGDNFSLVMQGGLIVETVELITDNIDFLNTEKENLETAIWNSHASGSDDQDLSGLIPYTGANADVDLGLYDLSATTLTSKALTATRIPYIGTAGLIVDSADLTWDNTNKRLGIASNVSIDYDGTKGNIKTDLVAPSDLNIDCGTDRTLVLEETVWDDFPPNPIIGAKLGSSAPTLATFVSDIEQYTFDATNDYVIGSTEIPHNWKEGTTIYPHIHWATNGTNANDRGVKWQLKWSVGDDAEVFSAQVTSVIDTTIPLATADRTHFVSEFATTMDGTNLKIGAVICWRLERIATAHDNGEPAADPFGLSIGFHGEMCRLGSRQKFIA